MPKGVEKAFRRYFRLKEQAADAFAAAEAVLNSIIDTTHRGQPAVKPGLVYRFNSPLRVKDSPKSTIQIVDNFTPAPGQRRISKMCMFTQFSVNTWVGDGPAKDRPAKAALRAEEEQIN